MKNSFVVDVVAVCLLLACCACSGLSASPHSPLPSNDAALDGLARNYTPEKINNCLATELTQQGGCRNTIVQAMLAAIDLRYAEFEVSLLDADRYGNFGATVGTLGLTAAGSLSGGGTARALSAAAAALTGTREAFDRNALFQQTVLSLQAAMQGRRNEIAIRIREGLRRHAPEYPLGAAFSDLFAYFRAGTLVGALVGTAESVAERSRDSRRRLSATVVRRELQEDGTLAGVPASTNLSQSSPTKAGRPGRNAPGVPPGPSPFSGAGTVSTTTGRTPPGVPPAPLPGGGAAGAASGNGGASMPLQK